VAFPTVVEVVEGLWAPTGALQLGVFVPEAHDIRKSLHGPTGQQGVDQGWLWGEIIREVVYLGRWRGPDIAAAPSQSSMIGIAARRPPSESGEPRHILQECWSVG